MTTIFDQMLSRYDIRTNDDYNNALHEVMQLIALAGLNRGGFFKKAAFYGGTCLRIFYDLQRFSEDMDFSLLQPDAYFKLEDYFEPVSSEFKSLGREIVFVKNEKLHQSNIESAFLKDDTAIYNLQFRTDKQIKIKIEIDTKPPSGFNTEYKLQLLPFSFTTRCYTLLDMYAGKLHALLFRNWKTRVKGRDWYDFEWYVRNNTPLNFEHLRQRCYQSGYQHNMELTKETFKHLLKEKIAKTNIEMVKNDVRPFIRNQSEMDIWSVDYFLQLVEMIKYK